MEVKVQRAVTPFFAGHGTLLRVLILYEDFAVGKRAIDAYNLMIAQFGDTLEFRNSMWKFDLLRLPKLREIATLEAVEAELIIVAVHNDGLLPDDVRAWIEGWMSRRGGRGGALAVLVDHYSGSGGGDPPVFSFLKAVATSNGMDFLPNATTAVVSAIGAQDGVSDNLDEVSAETSRIRRWGLNE